MQSLLAVSTFFQFLSTLSPLPVPIPRSRYLQSLTTICHSSAQKSIFTLLAHEGLSLRRIDPFDIFLYLFQISSPGNSNPPPAR
ncbi:hypothetical protein F4818DRAFT_390325 [Hypoxylon cercidicola]|nr:hypothetical protein F4818DRAFT_390325 [Hypoxylon cercidicola]